MTACTCTPVVMGAPASRIVICGVPKAGKTTLGGACARHTDDLMPMDWSDVSITVGTWFDAPGLYVIEGVRAVHALRKWLATHPTGAPCDRVVWLGTPRVPLSRGQATMAKGCTTVWAEVRPLLLARDVQVEES